MYVCPNPHWARVSIVKKWLFSFWATATFLHYEVALLICQPAKHIVIFPTTVIAACKVTNHCKSGVLSKKCQVQAHIALTSAGNIPRERLRQAKLPVASAYNQISQIAVIHSITLETWIIQVGIESTCIYLSIIVGLFRFGLAPSKARGVAIFLFWFRVTPARGVAQSSPLQ